DCRCRRRAGAAAPSTGRARSLVRRRRYLACRDHSWHHSGGRPRSARAARRGQLLRSVSGPGRSAGRREPFDPAHVPGRRSHLDRRGGAAERRRHPGGARRRARRRAALTCSGKNGVGERMTMAKTATRGVDLEPIDRLEEKMKLLVGMVERMKAEQARAAEENQRLARELESMRGRLAASDSLASELSTMKEE